jgi:hypothetical protein
MEAGKFYLIKTDTGGALTGLRVHCLAVYRTHVSLYQMGMHYFVPLSSLTYSELKMPEVGKHYHINGIIDGVTRHDVALCVEHIRDMEFKLVFPGGRSFSVDVSNLTFIEVNPAEITEPKKMRYTDLTPNTLVKAANDAIVIRLGTTNIVIKLYPKQLIGPEFELDIKRLPYTVVRTSTHVGSKYYRDEMPIHMYTLTGTLTNLKCGGILFDITDLNQHVTQHTLYVAHNYYPKNDKTPMVLQSLSHNVKLFNLGSATYECCIVSPEDKTSIELNQLFE